MSETKTMKEKASEATHWRKAKAADLPQFGPWYVVLKDFGMDRPVIVGQVLGAREFVHGRIAVMRSQGFIGDPASMSELLRNGAACSACGAAFALVVSGGTVTPAYVSAERHWTATHSPKAEELRENKIAKAKAEEQALEQYRARRLAEGPQTCGNCGASHPPSHRFVIPLGAWEQRTNEKRWSPDTGKPVMIAAAMHGPDGNALPPSAA